MRISDVKVGEFYAYGGSEPGKLNPNSQLLRRAKVLGIVKEEEAFGLYLDRVRKVRRVHIRLEDGLELAVAAEKLTESWDEYLPRRDAARAAEDERLAYVAELRTALEALGLRVERVTLAGSVHVVLEREALDAWIVKTLGYRI